MDSILDRRSPTADQVLKIGITMSTHPFNPDIEPLPHLDYYLLNQLVALARPHLNKHQLKRLEYTVDARRSFYEAHQKFQIAYRDLLDAYVCAELLDKKCEALKRQLADTLAVAASDGTAASSIRRQLSAIDIQRRSNNEDMRVCLQYTWARTKKRDHVALWYSNLKVLFLRDEMPLLLALGKQSYERAVRQRKERPTVGSVSPSATGWDHSDHCSDSGGSSTPDLGMEDSGFGMEWN